MNSWTFRGGVFASPPSISFDHIKVKALSVCCKYCVVFSSKPGIFILDNCSRPFQIGESTPSVQVYKFPLVEIVCIFSPAMFCPSGSFWQQRLHCPLHQKSNDDYWLFAIIIRQSSKKLKKNFYRENKTNWKMKKKTTVYSTYPTSLKLSTKTLRKIHRWIPRSFHSDFVALLISHQLTQGLSRLQQETCVKYIFTHA